MQAYTTIRGALGMRLSAAMTHELRAVHRLNPILGDPTVTEAYRQTEFPAVLKASFYAAG